MPDSKLKVNFRSTSFTPSGGSLTAIAGVQGIDFDPSGNLLKFSGDMDRYPTTIINDFIDNIVTITAGDVGAIRSLTPGTRGAMSTIHKASGNQLATSGAGSLDMTYTITNPLAIIQNNPTSGQHRAFSTGRLIICAESSDGLTNPLATSIA